MCGVVRTMVTRALLVVCLWCTSTHVTVGISTPRCSPPNPPGLPENLVNVTQVSSCTATSDVVNGTVFYIATVKPPDGKFTFNYTNGVLSTVANPNFDFETFTQNPYQVTVTAYDGVASATRTFTVPITNVNEPPTIVNLPVAIKLTENDAGNYSIFTFQVTDPDVPAGAVTYSMVVTPPGSGSIFQLNVPKYDNQLYLAKNPGLNYEGIQDYNLSIIATDSGGLSSVPKYIHIELRDINEVPVFADSGATASIYEESPIGTTLVTSIGPIRALDPDFKKNDTVTYVIDGKFSDYFTVETIDQAAVITVAERIDREDFDVPVDGTFIIYVSALDRLKLRQTILNTFQIAVTILDVNDNPTICSPTIYHGVIKENSPIGTSILSVSCTDADDTVTWPITYQVDPTNDAFKYFYFPNSISQVLTAKYIMDKERGSLLTFLVYAMQGAPGNSSTTTMSVQITVVGVNDNRPVMSQSFYNFEFRNDAAVGTQIGSVSATDADLNATVVTYDWVYEITEFRMGTFSGVITTAKTFSPGEKYLYYALAQDNDIPPDVSETSPVRMDTFDPQLYLIDFQVTQPIAYFTDDRKQAFEDAISSACPPCFGRISSLQPTPGSPTSTTLTVYALTDSSTESLQNVGTTKTYIPKDTMLDIFRIDDQGTPSPAVALPAFFNFPVVKVTPTVFGLTFLEWLLYTPGGNACLALVILAAVCTLLGTLIYLWRTGALSRLFKLLMACDIGRYCKDCCRPSTPPEPKVQINHPEKDGDFNVFEFRYKDKPLAVPKKER